MGWREWLAERFELSDAGGIASWDDWLVTVEDMPEADRIAMATSLLSGTGYIATSGRVLAEQWKAQSFNVDRDRK